MLSRQFLSPLLESNKRKVSDEGDNEEPPPIPPRKRPPPEKPPRRIENTETTAAEESLKQKKMVKKLRGKAKATYFVITEADENPAFIWNFLEPLVVAHSTLE